MASNVSFDWQHISFHAGNSRLDVVRVDINWTAASDGSVTATDFPDDVMWKVGGSYLFLIDTIPGTTQPTDSYGITITNSDSLDILNGALAGLSASEAQRTVPKQDTRQALYGPVLTDPDSMKFNIANNSVDSATGTVRLYCTGG